MRTIAFLVVILYSIQDAYCGGPYASEISNDTKVMIINLINGVRDEVSIEASDMKKVSWDDELRKYCENNVIMNCPNIPNNAEGNFFEISHAAEFGEEAAEQAFEDWGAQKELFDQKDCKSANRTKCQKYARMIKGANDKIGCGATTCGRLIPGAVPTQVLIICCRFGPTPFSDETDVEQITNFYTPKSCDTPCRENYGCMEGTCVSCELYPVACQTTTPAPTTSPNPTTSPKPVVTTKGTPEKTTSGSGRHTSHTLLPYVIALTFLLKANL